MLDIPIVKTLPIPPDAGKISDALSRIGYKLEEAIADIVDNSIDASANNVLIRIAHDGENIRRIIILDDGKGMNWEAFIAAMQFGTAKPHDQKDLGKFGMGLKTAAFSQGRRLTVISRQDNFTNAGRWTTKSISKGWQCQILDSKSASLVLDGVSTSFNDGKNGTLIVIDDLDHLRVSEKGIESTLQKIQKSLSTHLGLTFHRFIANGFRICVDAILEGANEAGFSIMVPSLNPFGYVKSGDSEYPKEFSITLNGFSPLRCVAHIWPANQKSNEYILGGGAVAKRQGFFFYRNDRLIQAGGWNGWRIADAEPHLSLARVEVELQPEFDSQFRLNVQKSSVDVPDEFRAMLNSRQCIMPNFIKRADEVYRKKTTVESYYVPVPGRGFDGKTRRRAATYLSENKLPHKEINLIWKRLYSDQFFEIDRATGCIFLNASFRQDILKDLPASLNDAPMIKMLVFLLLKDDLMRERESQQSIKRQMQLNEMLMLALAEERERH